MIICMFSFMAAAIEVTRRADVVSDLDRGPYVLGQIKPSVILNAYNVDLFAHSNGLNLRFYLQVSHSIVWRNVE